VTRQSRLLLASFLLLPLLACSPRVARVPDAASGQVPIAVLALTSPVAAGSQATLQVQTTPGVDCGIVVLYKSGPSQAQGLYLQRADHLGRVAWTWRVETNTAPGRWPITVVRGVGDREGELRTSFEVR
jgi:hypothetical protein